MTGRERLRFCYELAFHPPRLNEAWRRIKNGTANVDELGEMLDTALLLHQSLPSTGYASQRALNRLALYQAKARAFGTVSFLKNIRQRIGRGPLPQTELPGHLVRDIGLPPFCRGVGARRSKDAASRGPKESTSP